MLHSWAEQLQLLLFSHSTVSNSLRPQELQHARLPSRQWHPTPVLLPGKIPWTEEPGRQSMGLRRVRHDWATSLSLFTFMHGRRKWQTHSSVLAWRIPGMGSHRVGHDWSDLAAVAVAGFPQTHVHCVSDTIQPSHPLSSPSLDFYLSQPQVLFQWPGSLHQVAKV